MWAPLIVFYLFAVAKAVSQQYYSGYIEMLNLVNAARVAHNVPPLCISPYLRYCGNPML
jgi:hypothetical protein